MKLKAEVIKIIVPSQDGTILITKTDNDIKVGRPFYASPCTPFAGPGFGFMFLPEVGDQVWVEQTADGTWVYSGFFWSKANQPPAEATAKVRILKTPAGHKLQFDDEGNVELEHAGGAKIVLKPDGDIEINGNGGNAVRFAELQVGFDQLKSDLNTHAHTVTSAPGTTGMPTTPSTASIDSAKVNKVKLP